MKKLFVLAVVLMLVFSLSSVAVMARSQHKGLLFNRIVILEESNPIMIVVSVERVDTKIDVDDGKVVVSIPELGLRASRRIDITDRRESKSILLDIPEGISGEYYVRIVITTDDVKRVRHRLITI